MARSPLSTEHLQTLARRGAQARIAELRAELDGILRAFPDLGDTSRPARRSAGAAPAGAPAARNQSYWSAAKRKAVSARMKKYWAERRKADTAKGK